MEQDSYKNSRFGRLEARVRDLEARVRELEDEACTNFGSCVINSEKEDKEEIFRAR